MTSWLFYQIFSHRWVTSIFLAMVLRARAPSARAKLRYYCGTAVTTVIPFNVLSYPCLTACFHHAVGVADRSIIGDDQMTASSYNGYTKAPHFGRLNGILYGWWALTSNSLFDWLQIDFERTVKVCAVETQGSPLYRAWVIDFYLSFSSDGASWSNSTYENGTQVVSLTRWVT